MQQFTFTEDAVERELQEATPADSCCGVLPKRIQALRIIRDACVAPRQVVKDHPGNVGYLSELAAACILHGGVLRDVGRLDEARAALDEGKIFIDDLIRGDPENEPLRYDLANAYIVAAEIDADRGRLDEAMNARRARLAILEGRTRDQPGDSERRDELAAEIKSIDELNARMGRVDRRRSPRL